MSTRRIVPLVVIAHWLTSNIPVYARTYSFDAAMLGDDSKVIDMSLFEHGLQQEGRYFVTILINSKPVEKSNVTFRKDTAPSGEDYLKPCLSLGQLARWGIKTGDYPQLTSGTHASKNCVDLFAISALKPVLDLGAEELRLSIPQAAIKVKFSGIAPEEIWDEGITALRMNYKASSNTTKLRAPGTGGKKRSTIVMLEPGMNVGAWRLRNSVNWHKAATGVQKWQSSYSYAQRDIVGIKSTLTFGERTTRADLFDGVPFTGFMLASNQDMFDSRQRNFSPTVRGVAHSQAQVEVRQDGYLLYTTSVPPGPFELTDFSTAGNGGNLEVTVRESEGKDQIFYLPWQTPAIALREGYFDYALMAGHYRPSDGNLTQVPVSLATLMYGLPKNITAYGGLLGAAHYQAAAAGLGISLGNWGGVSLDSTAEQSQISDKYDRAGNWRLRYTNQISATGSYVSLTHARNLSPQYRTLSDTLSGWRKDGVKYSSDGGDWQQRTTTSFVLSQSIAMIGYLGFSATHAIRYNQSGNDSLRLSWSRQVSDATLSLDWSKNLSLEQHKLHAAQSELNIWLSLPLDRWSGADNNISSSWSVSSPSDGPKEQQFGLSGNAFSHQFSWNAQQNQTSGYQGSASRSNSQLGLFWRGGYGQLGANYGYSQNQRQMGVNLAGGMVAHRHGITLTQALGESSALVELPGAGNVKLNGYSGVSTDYRGYAVVPSLSNYRVNTISLNPTLLPDNVEVKQTDIRVVPTKGALVRAEFAASIGKKAIITITDSQNKPAPFGAAVHLPGQEDLAGIVNDEGQVYVAGLPDKGKLRITAGQQHCIAPYQITEQSRSAGIYVVRSICQWNNE